MQVNGLSSGYPDATALSKREETQKTADGRATRPLEAQLGSAIGPSTVFAEILSKYDVKAITPVEFSAMTQKLYEAGAISDEELQQLTAIRHDLDTAGVDADESIDLLQYYVDQIEKLQRRWDASAPPPPESQQLSPLLRRLDWIEKFALIQAAPDSIGFTAMA